MSQPLAPTASRRRLTLAAFAALSIFALPAQSSAGGVGTAETEERLTYVLLAPGGQSSTMSGSMEDLRRARSLRSGDEGLLYVREGGAAYVIRHAATLREAEAIFAPQQALGAKQAELGSRQAALGARQARLGAEQARLGARQASVPPRQAGELGRRQGELGRQQHALGQQQHVLGREQGELGREQARLARVAETKMRALIAQAAQRGVAQRVN